MIKFKDFAVGVYPFLDLQPFHEAYYRLLQYFAEGRVRRLMITMPPQHGKSVGATTLLPAYMLGLNPDMRIAIASYSASLASKFNRRVQRIIDSAEYAAIFPQTTIKHGSRPAEYIRTADEAFYIFHIQHIVHSLFPPHLHLISASLKRLTRGLGRVLLRHPGLNIK